MKKTVILVLLSYSLILTAQTHIWERTNPGGGGAFSTIEAGLDGTLIAGSDLSGAYISYDFGNTWEVIGANRGLTETHVSAIGFSQNDSNIFYIGTENGIFRTHDKGASVYRVLNSGYITDIQFSENNPNIGYAAYHPTYDSNNGVIFKSTDNGLTWGQISTDLPVGIRILKIVIAPNNENIIYVLTGNGRFACSPAHVYKSINGGINWVNITSRLNEILDIAIAPDNPNNVYITTMNASCSSQDYWTDVLGDLYKSTDEGNSWNYLSDYTGVIFLYPSDSNIIRLIDPREPFPWNPRAGTFTSTNGGMSFTQTGNVNNWDTFFNGNVFWSYSNSFDGICKTLGKDLSNPDKIYWINSQWCFGSENNGTTFENLFTNEVSPNFWRSRGFDNVNMMDVCISKANPNIIYAAYFDIGLWQSLDNGESWQSCNDNTYTGSWNGYGGNCATVLADPDRQNVVWASQSENQNGEYPTYLLKNLNTGDKNSWVLSDFGLPNIEIMGLSIDENSNINNRTLYVTAEGDVYKSINDGANWIKVFDCDGCRFTAVDKFNGNLVYSGGENGLWRSLDGGTNWTNISHPDMIASVGVSFWDWDYNGVFDVKTDPNNPNTLFVTALGSNKGLYKSVDAGNSWTKLLTDDFMRKVAIVPQNSNFIYVTSSSAFEAGGYDVNSMGILFSQDGGQSWTQETQNMAYPFGLVIDISITSTPTIIVGSPGTGFQKTTFPIPLNIHGELSVYSNPTKSSVYPNPTNNFIFFETPKTDIKKIKVFNIIGQNVTTQVDIKTISSNIIKINLSQLPYGAYIIRSATTANIVYKQ